MIVLIDTGARIKEALNVTHKQIGRGTIRFENTKNGKFRTTPLTRRAQAALERRRVQGGDPERPFGDLTYDWSIKKMREVYDHLGGDYEAVTQPFHIFRHSCASRLAIKGVDANRIKEWCDHSSLVVTQRYMKLAPGALDDVVSVLEQGETATKFKVVR